jgi:hypothetical protein
LSRKRKHFVIGKDFRSDGHTRITRGDDYIVEGGTEITHEETTDIVGEFSRRLRKEGAPPPETAREILREVITERRRHN